MTGLTAVRVVPVRAHRPATGVRYPAPAIRSASGSGDAHCTPFVPVAPAPPARGGDGVGVLAPVRSPRL
ncbi:hypothetical protein GCM10023083_00080 [Streptomyces phyllanthi]